MRTTELFADDILILGGNEKEVQHITNFWSEKGEQNRKCGDKDTK